MAGRGTLGPVPRGALLAAATKEQIPLIVGCLGIWYGASRRRPFAGAAIFGTGLALTAIDFLYVIPRFSASGSDPFDGRYTDVGGAPAGILETAFVHPLRVTEVVLALHKLVYLALLVVPLLGLCLWSPLLLAAAVPQLALQLLSSSPEQASISSHYVAPAAAVLLGATVLGAARLRVDPRRLSGAVLAAVALTAVISPFWIVVPTARHVLTGSPVLRAERHAVGLVPSGASVSASNVLGAHLSARRRILLFPEVREAHWLLVDTTDTEGGPSFRPALRRLREQGLFATVYRADGIVVMRRLAP